MKLQVLIGMALQATIIAAIPIETHGAGMKFLPSLHVFECLVHILIALEVASEKKAEIAEVWANWNWFPGRAKTVAPAEKRAEIAEVWANWNWFPGRAKTAGATE